MIGLQTFPRADVIAKKWENLDNLKNTALSRTIGPISTNLSVKHPWAKGIEVFTNERPI